MNEYRTTPYLRWVAIEVRTVSPLPSRPTGDQWRRVEIMQSEQSAQRLISQWKKAA